MSSNTKELKTKRNARERNAGRKRKKNLQKKGSTRTEAELFGNTKAGDEQ